MPTATAKRPATVTRKYAAGSPLHIEIAQVNADLAREWMDTNENRNIRRRKVVEFRRDMVAGNWRDVGDPVRFDTTGKLIDGQHRLSALIEATEELGTQLVITLVVVRGVKPEDRIVIDTGTKRTIGDQLRLAGYANSPLLGAAARWCILYERGALYAEMANRSVTHAEILDYVKANPVLVDVASVVMASMVKKIDMPPGYVTAGYYLTSEINVKQSNDFFHRLADGVGLPAGDPILALRSQLRTLDKQRANLSGDMWLSLLFRAWNSRRAGKSMRSVPVYKGQVPVACPELK